MVGEVRVAEWETGRASNFGRGMTAASNLNVNSDIGLKSEVEKKV